MKIGVVDFFIEKRNLLTLLIVSYENRTLCVRRPYHGLNMDYFISCRTPELWICGARAW